MNKYIILLLLLSLNFQLVAQKKEKIKGNKIVSDRYGALGAFNSIDIADNLQVNLSQGTVNGFHVNADENLLDLVKFDTLNGSLKIYTSHNITASKKLEINLTFTEVDAIKLHDDTKLKSKNKLTFNQLNFTALDNASFLLDLNAETSQFNLYRGTSGTLNLKGNQASFVLNENAFVKGNIVLDALELTINNRADINIEGDINELELTATGSSDIKAKKLKTSKTKVNASNKSDIYIYATKELRIFAKGKSNIYVYGNPEIIVDALNDKSQIIKK